MAQNAILLFLPVQFNLSKEVCCKVSLCEKFQRHSCSYFIPLSKSMYCGRRPHLPKICAQSYPRFRKRRFRQISLYSASAVRVSEKSLIITIRKSTMRFDRAIHEPCALPLSPQRVAQNEIFTHFCVAYHIFVASNRRHFKCGMPIDHSKS